VCACAIAEALLYPHSAIPAATQHAASVDDHIWTVLIGGHQMGRGAGYVYHYQNHYITSKRPESKTRPKEAKQIKLKYDRG